MRRCSPASNGSETVPRYASIRSSSPPSRMSSLGQAVLVYANTFNSPSHRLPDSAFSLSIARALPCIFAIPLAWKTGSPVPTGRNHPKKSCLKPSHSRNPNATHPVRSSLTPATRMRYIATEIPTLSPTPTILCQVDLHRANNSAGSTRRVPPHSSFPLLSRHSRESGNPGGRVALTPLDSTARLCYFLLTGTVIVGCGVGAETALSLPNWSPSATFSTIRVTNLNNLAHRK